MRETDGVAPKLWESHNREALNVKSLDRRARNVRMMGREAWECSILEIKGPQGIRILESREICARILAVFSLCSCELERASGAI